MHVNACLDSAAAEAGPSESSSKRQISAPKDTASDSSPAPKPQPISSFAHVIRPQSPLPQDDTPVKGANAFSMLMNRNKETDMWKEASKDEKRDSNRRNGPRKAPFYKVSYKSRCRANDRSSLACRSLWMPSVTVPCPR